MFGIAWRTALVLLPWQTRWFHDASLSGWLWEQGRVSIYLSWIPLLLTIALGMSREWMWWKVVLKRREARLVFALIVIGMMGAGLDPPALLAVLQWWIQIGLLMLFGTVMYRRRIALSSFLTWFVLALIPSAVLGLWQEMSQMVSG